MNRGHGPGFAAFLGSFLLLCAVLQVFLAGQAAGYESSIYASLPRSFWLMISGSLLIGVIVVVVGVLNPAARRRNWLSGFVITFVASAVLFLLPLMRGYEIYGRGDALTHLGWITDIALDGTVGSSDLYPVDHILGFLLSECCNVQSGDVTSILPTCFSLSFIVYVYILSRTMFEDNARRACAISIGFLPLFGYFHTLLAPFAQAVFVFPVFLFVFLKSRDSKSSSGFSIALIILVLFVLFLHPLAMLFVIAVLVLFGSTRYSLCVRHPSLGARFSLRGSSRLLVLTLGLFLAWQSYAYALANSLARALAWISGDPITTELQKYSVILAESDQSIFGILGLLVRFYGQALVIGVISIFSVVACAVGARMASSAQTRVREDLAMIGFLTFVVCSGVALVSSYQYGFYRFYVMAIIFSLFVIPAGCQRVRAIAGSWGRARRLLPFLRVSVIGVLVISLISMSVLNLHLSPYVKSSNQQVTAAELMGMTTFFESRDEDLVILEFGILHERFYDAIYGSDCPRRNIVYGGDVDAATRPLDHFGYDVETSFGESIDMDSYFLLTDLGRSFYPWVYPEYESSWRFTEEDFMNLEVDNTVQLVQDIGGLQVYLVLSA